MFSACFNLPKKLPPKREITQGMRLFKPKPYWVLTKFNCKKRLQKKETYNMKFSDVIVTSVKRSVESVQFGHPPYMYLFVTLDLHASGSCWV